MSAPVFITATGTDAGKTHILCALLRALAARGARPLVLKPVVSGYDPADPAASDPGRLLAAQGLDVTSDTLAAISPFRFQAPLSPDMAAAQAGADLRLDAVAQACRAAAAGHDGPVFIEGAGGIMSPIAQDGLNLDLILALGARPVLICGAYLGAISHTLTALSAMRAINAPAEMIIVNPHPAGPAPAEDIVAALSRFTAGTPVLAWRDGGGEGAEATLDALGF